MPLVYLAVDPSFSSSGIRYQGSIDSLSGTDQGDPIPCPGAFPCEISARLRVTSGTASISVQKVYAGASHLVLQEEVHDYYPASSPRIRSEIKAKTVRTVGGRYLQDLTTIEPLLEPYVNTGNLPSISLSGLPSALYSSLVGFPSRTTLTPDAANPAAAGNVHSYVDKFSLTFDNFSLQDGVNLLWTAGTVGNLPISINLAGYDDSLTPANRYLRGAISSLTAFNAVKFHIYPTITAPNLFDADNSSGAPITTDVFAYPASYFAPMENAPQFPCFSGNINGGVGQASTVLGLQTSNYVRSLAVYEVPDDPQMQGLYAFAGVKEDDTPFIGMFSKSDPANTTPTAEFFKAYSKIGNPFASGSKPALYFRSNLQSRSQLTPGGFTNTYWSAAYPAATAGRYSKYLDVKSTQYGFVLLNKDTKHLEFMFQPHLEPWFESADVQVVNKLMHAPPRSADYIPALNMLLGISPLDPTGTSTSLYSNAAAIPTGGGSYYDADSHLHGGGGHVAAMGTFNGAVVNDGKITVWGSNRWGQCVLPDAVKNVRIVDVAVSVSPPVLLDPGADTASYPPYDHSVYSDQHGERAARDYTATANDPFGVNTTGADPYMYSYPPMWTGVDGTSNIRHAKHINYTNLPGHVVVVTDAGWVYAWGNNLYRQCQVPSEISLVDNTGAVKTGAPVTPISEVAAGAFHTVARARNGALYVWGAGGVATGGTIGFPSGVGETTPVGTLTYPGGTVYGSVQFGQSFLGNATSTGTTSHGLATPANIPPGTSAQAVQTYAAFNVYPVGNITTLVDPGGATVGQKTAAGFCPSDPAGGRLKGMIAAGAFHTAVIDSQLKIQCFGAGRGPCTGTTSSVVDPFDFTFFTQDGYSIPHWGNSFSRDNFYTFDTYPHYCQSMSQYRAPLASVSTASGGPYLFRFATSAAVTEKLKFFQDLRFKKVVCGPFTTHGIVYDVDRVATTQQFSAADKAFMHGRVVSWGQVYSPRGKYASATGSTGVLHYSRVNAGTTSLATASSQGWASSGTSADLAGTIAGMGSANYLSGLTGAPASPVPRMFRLLNKQLSSSTPTTDPATLLPVSTATENQYRTRCPVTISTFKVKDMASCGDFAMYIGYVNALEQDSVLHHPSDSVANSGATFDYQASVFFTGNDYYHNSSITNSVASSAIPGRLHTNNPYAGTSWVRRNKLGHLDGIYQWNGDTGLKIKDRSPYFGFIRQDAVTGLTLATGDASTARAASYVIPTSAFASCNFVAMAVNMDNRPVAWTGFFQLGPEYLAPLDLSLLPSVPLSSFKTGKAHIMAVTDGDWPISISLATSAGTPKVCSELGTRLFNSAPAVTTSPTLLWGESSSGQADGTSRVRRPVLLSWGAGDGREYGTSLLAFSIGSGSESTYGMWFLDTHAISRYDGTYNTGTAQPLAVSGQDPWENFYGHYRWNVYSKYDKAYIEPNLQSATGGGGIIPGTMGERLQPTGAAITLPKGHAAVEAMQSILNFRYDQYPTTFATPGLINRSLFNGVQQAAVPSAALRPWIASTDPALSVRNQVCCTTAADAAPTARASINTAQEYHASLGMYLQNYSDYVVDYAAGSMHSAILFSSSILSFSDIQSGTHLANLAAFTSSFMVASGGGVPFGSRRICKVALQGYGCEGQTGASERLLNDGSLAPIVPMMFSRDARVYAGESYTLVTNPIKVVVASSSAVAVTLTDTGSGYSTMTVPVTIPSSRFSRRIRGLDVILTFTATAAPASIPLSSWTIKIPYKQATWTVLGRVKANTNGTPAAAFVPSGTATTVYRVSDRFDPAKAYKHVGTVDTYDESGLNPAVSFSYPSTAPFTLLGIDSAASIKSLSKQGNYYPVTVDSATNAVTVESWAMQSSSGVSYPFDESTINVVIEDVTSATSYSGYTVTATLEVEVDAGQVPYVLFGPSRSGVFNESSGRGPSYVADIGSFVEGTLAAQSCPCETTPAPSTRKYPKSFPADSKFLCGTKKYGPLGNRENLAGFVTESYFDPVTFVSREPLLKAPKITANFFNLFDTIPHRPLLKMAEGVREVAPTLHVLPPGAFLQVGVDRFMDSNTALALSISSLTGPNAYVQRGLVGSSSLKLQMQSALMYNAALRAVSTGLALSSSNAALNFQLSLKSGVDCP